MLQVDNIHTYYGSSHILHGVSLQVNAGEVVTLLGRNGMGKTTTLRSILGLTPVERGRVTFASREITRWRPHRVARLGVGYVPEGRQIFPSLSVEENLLMASRSPGNGGGWRLRDVYTLFPRLAERRANWGNELSGGEAQMLAIGRALLLQPRLLLLDEATEGLAPLLREEIWEVIEHIKGTGLSILLVDKNIDALLSVAQRHIILNKGRIIFSGTSAELEAQPELMHENLGV